MTNILNGAPSQFEKGVYFESKEQFTPLDCDIKGNVWGFGGRKGGYIKVQTRFLVIITHLKTTVITG